jgi:uncharacterized protein (UPF0216 family)
MMATKEIEDLDKILSEIEPAYIPDEFVTAARVTETDGGSYIITKTELDELMDSDDSLEELGIYQIRFIVNLEMIRSAINEYSGIILKSIPL